MVEEKVVLEEIWKIWRNLGQGPVAMLCLKSTLSDEETKGSSNSLHFITLGKLAYIERLRIN